VGHLSELVDGPNGCNIGDWEEDADARRDQAEGRIKRNEK